MTPSQDALRRDRAALVGELEAAGATVKGAAVKCCFHEDKTASGSIYNGEGAWRFKCHACGAGGDVFDVRALATGRPLPDVLAEAAGRPQAAHAAPRSTNAPKPAQAWPTFEAATQAGERITKGKLAGDWTYHKADGSESFHALRFDLATIDPATGKVNKTFRPCHAGAGGWMLADPDGLLPLYRLPQLLAADPGAPVILCEGEKAADAAAEAGFAATTSAHGCNSAGKTDFAPLAGRRVFVLPDNDGGGEAYAATAAGLLLALDPPAQVRVVHLPDLPPKGDFFEWVSADGPMGCRDRDEIRAAVLALADAAPDWTPTPADAAQAVGQAVRPVAILRSLAGATPKAVDWLWPGRLPLGKVSLLIGNPGGGKSTLTACIAARLSRGHGWPDHREPFTPGATVFLSGEDDPDDTLLPRLLAAGADTSRISTLDGVQEYDHASGRTKILLPDLDSYLDAIGEAVATADARLLVIDPVSSFVGKVDDHRNAELRGLLSRLAKLAGELRCAVLCVSHLRKAGGPAVHQAVGSLAYTAAARAVWALVKDPDEDDRRLLLPVKMNLCRDTSGLAFRLHTSAGLYDVPICSWEDAPITATADDLLNPGNRPGRPPAARDDAAEWLSVQLAAGPREAKELLAAAADVGITAHTLRRAKAALKVRLTKAGFDGGWVWTLPQGNAQDAR